MTALAALLSSCAGETITITDPMIFGNALTINVHDNHQILYQVDPEGTPVTWTSSNPGIVYVVGDWLVGNSTGNAVISGTTPKGGNADIYVYVNPLPVTGFNIPETLELYVDQTVELPVSNIKPEDADAGSIIWTSSEGGVISWKYSEGKVLITGIDMGVTEFHGTGTGGADETCIIRVKEAAIELSPASFSLLPGETRDFTLKQTPHIYDNVEWSISDGSIASISVDGDKCTVTAGSLMGKTTVTAKAGRYELKGNVTVIGEDYQPYLKICEYSNLYNNHNWWPCNIIEPRVFKDGDVVDILPNEVIYNAFNDGYGYVFGEESRIYTHLCLEDGSLLPGSLSEQTTIEFSDPNSIAYEKYIWTGNTDFWVILNKYSPGKQVSAKVTTPKGKSCTIKYQTKVNHVAISRFDPNQYSARKELGDCENGGTITIQRSSIKEGDKIAVDLSSFECFGYAMTKKGCLTSSNTSVAQVYSHNSIAYLFFDDGTTGTTKLTIKTSNDVTVATATLVVR